ncbi:MAG TPA: DNA alkylation repair protein [Acidimicrobiales bacterium]|nr:DNA alkylation repair protein [Acidimicrobiales bacterium]
MVDPEAVADGIEDDLRAVGTPARAEGSKRYLKSDLDFVGATVGQVRSETKRAGAALDHAGLLAVVDALWAAPVFERRLTAALLLESRVDVLEAGDLGVIERLLRDSRTWALVDVLAGNVAGLLLLRHPEVIVELDRWAADDDFWIRRSALLALRKPMQAGLPLDRFLRYADAMLDEKEFFVRKAIGWVLREEGRRRPGEIVAWLSPRAHRASGVTMREAVKYLPPEDREALMAAYRGRRAMRP